MEQNTKAPKLTLAESRSSGSTSHDHQASASDEPDEANEPRVADSEPHDDSQQSPAGRPKKRARKHNNLRRIRIERMMSKAELARRANLSVLTIDRVEKGLGCRMDTKRKILEALGLSLADRVRVFGEDE
jgi:DNA-binding XRE family transcriptional regulator